MHHSRRRQSSWRTLRGIAARSRSPRGAVNARKPLGAGAGLVDKHKRLRIEVELSLEPCLAPGSRRRDDPARPHARVFFERDPLPFEKTSHAGDGDSDPTLGEPCPQVYERDVRPLFQGTQDRTACASIRAERRPPPWRLGLASPTSFESACQRIALDALTPKRVAAWWHDLRIVRFDLDGRGAGKAHDLGHPGERTLADLDFGDVG